MRESMTGQQGLQMLQREKAQVVLIQEVPGSLEPKESSAVKNRSS